MDVKIAGGAATQITDTLAAQAEGLAALCALRQRNAAFAVKRRHCDFTAQRRSSERDGQFHVKIVALTFKELAGLYMHLNKEVACRTAVHTGFSAAGHADALTVVNTRRNIDLQNRGRTLPARALAVGTWIRNHLAGTVAVRTGLLHLEESVAHADDAGTTASRTRLLRRSGTAA